MSAPLAFGLTLANRGVLLGLTTPAALLDLAERADASGAFDSVWVGDSLFAKPRLEAVTLLAGIAARTKRVRLGPACLASFPLRQPLVFAYEWASLDLLAEGRTILIICAGGGSAGDWEQEARAIGVPVAERQKRLEEHLAILRKVWSEDHVSFEGRFHQFSDVTLEPKPAQRPCPIWLANNPHTVSPDPKRVERALRRTARLADGWMTHSLTPELFRERWDMIREYAREEGRSVEDNCLYHNINVNEDREAAFAETKKFLDAYYSANFSRERVEAWSSLGTPAECAASLSRWRGSGVRRIALRLCSWDQLHQLERVLNEVLPLVDA